MNAKKQLNSKILEITMLVQETHPELSKFIEEFPVTIPTEKFPIITSDILQDYYNSLTLLLNNYLLKVICNNE